MGNEFKREERYIVIKIKDAQAVDSDEPFNGYDHLRAFLKQQSIPTREGLVIEKDWPEYEPTWAAIERRVTGAVQWDGKGLPPVGTWCEYIGEKHGLESGAHVEIIHHFHAGAADVAVFIYSKGIGMGRHVAQSIAENFRPIRTPEQIAAEEQAKAVHQMGLDAGFSGSVQEFAVRLYQAGYRKHVAP